MERENEKQTVITLNDESFKHYLIERYRNNPDYSKRTTWNGGSHDLISGETLIQLYNRAKEDLRKKGGTLIGYELVNNILLSHDGVHSNWPMNWMWVIQFGHD
ncbi:hypothetical protein [Dyadobacter sp. MSC1_007]|jgi:hypothetical protein|uniref:hypothetical protein n=1 Tax=Dyadobacter sp. MSC1_007 TaxID=2909264 RepID=UPI00202EF75E|nr:hypothetical protein [Dyadobacter sp. MSC1_007]